MSPNNELDGGGRTATPDGQQEPVPDAGENDADPVELTARVRALSEQNRQLRDENSRAKRTKYRRSALGLAAIGVVAIISSVLFPAMRSLLVVLGTTGLFGAVLTYYLTPERFISAEIGREVYDATAELTAALVDELGLRDIRVYVPVQQGDRVTSHLFVPKFEAYEVPEPAALESLFVLGETEATRGIALPPTGRTLAESLALALGGFSSDPKRLADQLADGVVEQLELCDSVEPDVDIDAARMTFGVLGNAFGPVDRFDHPIASILAVGVATGLKTPVEAEVTKPVESRLDYLVTVRWDVADA